MGPAKRRKTKISSCLADANEDVDSGDNLAVGSSTQAKAQKETKAAPKVLAKTHKRGNAGKLAKLIDMPLDVFFEITSKLKPVDILQLSRVSKDFRSMFMSRGSRHVWVAARRNIPSLPKCPDDLNEAQYACLLFGKNCHACGGRAQKVDYSLRVRFCGSCWKERVKKGMTLTRPVKKRLKDELEVVYTLLPRSLIMAGWAPFNNESNEKNHHYYAPEIQMVMEKYLSLQSDPSALEAFVKEQKAIASRMMQHAQKLLNWEIKCKRRKAHDDGDTMKRRRESIEEKLLELGYDKSTYPRRNYKFDAMFSQPRDLTPRIWKTIRPKLEAMLEEERVDSLERRRVSRLSHRREEFRKFRTFWNKFFG